MSTNLENLYVFAALPDEYAVDRMINPSREDLSAKGVSFFGKRFAFYFELDAYLTYSKLEDGSVLKSRVESFLGNETLLL